MTRTGSHNAIRVLAPLRSVSKISRRALLGGFAVTGAAAVAGCGSGDTIAASKKPDGDTESILNLYDWGDYEDPKDIASFEKHVGPHVQIASFGSNEEMIAKLSATRGTSGYDVVVPTGLHVPQMLKHDLLQKLDKTQLPNFSNLDSSFRGQPWDPHNDYAIPKAVGTTGFLYDTTAIKGQMTSWRDFLEAVQHQASGKTAMQTDPWEVTSAYFAAHHINPNTTNKRHLQDCEDYLVDKIAQHVKAYLSTATSGVAQGGLTLIQAYNGDARQAIIAAKHPKKWKFVYPTPTANWWTDAWAVAKGTQHPDAAYKFINYMLDTDIAYNEMKYIGYPTGVKGLEEKAKRENLDYPELIFPTRKIKKRLTVNKLNSASERLTAILNHMRTRSGG